MSGLQLHSASHSDSLETRLGDPGVTEPTTLNRGFVQHNGLKQAHIFDI